MRLGRRRGALVLVDDTMHLRSMRLEYFRLAAALDAAMVTLHVRAPLACPVRMCACACALARVRMCSHVHRRRPSAAITFAGRGGYRAAKSVVHHRDSTHKRNHAASMPQKGQVVRFGPGIPVEVQNQI